MAAVKKIHWLRAAPRPRLLIAPRMRPTLQQFRAFLGANRYAASATAQLTRRARAAIYLYRLSIRILAQWARDKCPQQAAALAFQTALSLVPVTAIAFSVLRAMGSLDAESHLSEFISQNVFPQMEDIAAHISALSKNISVGALGGAGLFFTLITCYSLYSYVERIFNDIWRVGQRRALVGKFLTFYAMVTLLPTLAGFSLYWSGKLSAVGGVSQFVAPLLLQMVALVLMNKLLPRAQVNWSTAVVGALVTAFALEALKFAFVTYAKKVMLQSYAGVYGPLGLIPLVLVWMYVSWLLVLLGAEIAHALQNLRLLEAEDRRRRGEEPINGLLAAQLLAAVAATHQMGGAGHPKDRLATDFGLTPDIVERIAERLKARGLIAEVQGDLNGYIPARPASTILLEEVLGAFRSTDVEIASGATSPTLQALIADLDQGRQRRIAGVTVADLLPDMENTVVAAPEGVPVPTEDGSSSR